MLFTWYVSPSERATDAINLPDESYQIIDQALLLSKLGLIECRLKQKLTEISKRKIQR